jgi:hypothetical protein
MPYHLQCTNTACEHLQEAESAQTNYVALRREHAALKSKSEARILHLESQLASVEAGTNAQLDALLRRATQAEEKVGTLFQLYSIWWHVQAMHSEGKGQWTCF